VGESRTRISFLVTWLIVPFVLLSLASGKRGLYLLPLFPAFAVIVGWALDKIVVEASAPGKWFTVPLWVLGVSVILASAGMAGFVIYFKGSWLTCLLVLIPGVGLGSMALRRLTRNDIRGAALGSLTAVFVVFFCLGTWIYPLFDARKSYEPLFQYLRQQESTGNQIRLYRPPESISGATVFYLGHTLPTLRQIDALHEYLQSGAAAYALVVDNDIDRKESDAFAKAKTFAIGHHDYWILKNKDHS
jgi:4-amino-4-deoxy-L-arabinose transferase-like glycosyltransferase